MTVRRVLRSVLAMVTLVVHADAGAQAADSLTIAGLKWRSIGPAHSMGRLSDVVGLPSPSKTLFIAAAAGGIWKSGNNGVTWRPVFDDKRVASMGVLAIAPSDTQVMYAGTGEPNARYPVEPGAGVYKSTDGGTTWKLVGLEKTQHIGRIVVHPTNPNVAWVAAVGATYAPNPERGLYKTTDGGQTWTLSKFISNRAGFIDVAIDPRNPQVLYAASWARRRTPYMLESGGPGSGLWKTTDGGATWTEIAGGGFPPGVKGRIGIGVAPSNPDVVYALVEAARPTKDGSYTPEYHPIYAGFYRSPDGGKTWTKQNDYNDRPFYYSQVRVDSKNSEHVYFSSSPLQVTSDGGKTSRFAAQGAHTDTHGIWIDPNDPGRMAVAHDGGVAISFDGGGTFFSPMNLPLTQFYGVALDNAIPYNVCGGSQDNGAFCGPSRRQSGPMSNAYWSLFSGGDVVYAIPDPFRPGWVYSEAVSGNLSHINLASGERNQVRKPHWELIYQQWEDSIAALRGDPLKAPTREQAAAITALRTKQRQDSIDLDVRFGWEAAVLPSSHSPGTLYWGGSRVLKSTDYGEHMTLISPDLTKKLYAKIDTSMHLTGGISLETTQTELFGYTVALAESFVKPGIVYAGTDDGNVWMTRNDGGSWENLSGRFPGLANPEAYVSRIEASHFDTLTFYVAFDAHRFNDAKPYVYATSDGGKTFRSIVSNLPSDGVADYVHTIREDPRNRNLLFVGTSVAVYVSTDRGGTWSRFMTGMPTTPVFDLAIHPRDRELVAATHGRSFWIADIAPLEDMNSRTLTSRSYLFAPKVGLQWSEAPTRGNDDGHSTFQVNSPPYGAPISYRLAADVAGGDVRVVVANAVGDTLATLRGPTTAGVHTVVWNYQIAQAGGRGATVMSASMRRDSILRVARAPLVFDSLAKAGYDSVAIQRARELIAANAPAGGRGGRGGGGGGRGGRGGGGTSGVVTACERPLTQWDPFCARPGEGPSQGPRTSQGPFTSPLVVNNADPKKVLRIFDILGMSYFNTPGRSFLGSGNDGGQLSRVAGPGDYAVILIAGQDTMKQPLRVERAPSP